MRLLSLPLALLAAVAFAFPIRPEVVLKDRAKLDGKVIEVVGYVNSFRARTSKAGNKYFTFKIVERKSEVAAYGRGEAPKGVTNGAKVVAKGKFRKEKKIKDRTFLNEIEIDVRKKDSLFVTK